jgi:hypothetical protein
MEGTQGKAYIGKKLFYLLFMFVSNILQGKGRMSTRKMNLEMIRISMMRKPKANAW